MAKFIVKCVEGYHDMTRGKFWMGDEDVCYSMDSATVYYDFESFGATDRYRLKEGHAIIIPVSDLPRFKGK